MEEGELERSEFGGSGRLQKRKEVKKRKVEGYVCGGEKTKGKKRKKERKKKKCGTCVEDKKKREKKEKEKEKEKGITIFSQYFPNKF